MVFRRLVSRCTILVSFVAHLLRCSAQIKLILNKRLLLFCRQLIVERRCALQEQLRQESEPAMALHLASAILFQHYTNCMVHAPGRCVPQIISFLKEKLTPEHYDNLNHYVALVIKQLSGNEDSAVKNGDDHEQTEEHEEKTTETQLEEGLEDIKRIALEIKKIKEES